MIKPAVCLSFILLLYGVQNVQCQLSHYSNHNQQCLPCPQFCRSCHEVQGNLVECTSCQLGLQLNFAKANCEPVRIDGLSGTCLRQSQQRNATQFVRCAPGCQQCQCFQGGTTKCLKLMQGYFLIELQQQNTNFSGSNRQIIKKCRGNCQKCDAYIQTTDGVDKISQQNCTCARNSVIRQNVCIQCSDPHCEACRQGKNFADGNQYSICQNCDPYALLVQNQCKLCSSSQLPNCIKCQKNSSLSCVQCESGYILSKGICIQCFFDCTNCNPQNISQCLSCADGYYLKGNKCIVCESNCSKCQPKKCLQCIEGFSVTQYDTCTKNCQLPCFACENNAPENCTACLQGYYFNSSTKKCTTLIECQYDLQFDDNQTMTGCKVCPYNYYLSPVQDYEDQNSTNITTLECVNCTIKNCAICQTSGECSTCMPGFYLDRNGIIQQCLSCPIECQTCLNNIYCYSCAVGHTREHSHQKCIKCQLPCKTCTKNPKRCIECVDGYQKLGCKCFSPYRVVVYLLLDAQYQPYLKAQSFWKFQVAVSELVGRQNYDISFIAIQKGSVIFRFAVGALNRSQMGNLQKKIKEKLAVNEQFMSAKILVSFVQLHCPHSQDCQIKVTPNPTSNNGSIKLWLAIIFISLILRNFPKQFSCNYSLSYLSKKKEKLIWFKNKKVKLRIQ